MDFMKLGVLLCYFLFKANANLCEVKAGEDPCMNDNLRDVRYMDTRHPDVPFTVATVNHSFCDLFASDSDTWYKSDYNMTTYCVKQESCGTKYPIWMNGSIPTPAEGVVDRMACLRTYTACCEREYPMRVKNCNNFTIYCFEELPSGCPQRFCFDVDLSKTTTERTTTKQTTTEQPTPSTRQPTQGPCPNTAVPGIVVSTDDGTQHPDHRNMKGYREEYCIGLPWFILSNVITIGLSGVATIFIYKRYCKTAKPDVDFKTPPPAAVYEHLGPLDEKHIYEKPICIEKGEQIKQ